MLRPIVLKIFPSCMLGSDNYGEYDDVSAIRLSGTGPTGRKTATLPSNLRQKQGTRQQSSLSTLLEQMDRSAQQTGVLDGVRGLDDPRRVSGNETATGRTRTSSDDMHAERAVSAKS